MRIDQILRERQTFSFEIFPPKGDLPVEEAERVAGALCDFSPDWISVTFSAGGSGNSANTVAVASSIERGGRTQALAHLTCLGSSRADVDAYVARLREAGVENVLALRGDRAPGREVVDFAHASDLVAYLKKTAPDLCVGAACYPEGHVECESLEEDVAHLREKQDAGADFLVSQLFFDNEDFYRFRERCLRHRVTLPVVAGIMPFTSKKQIQRMSFTCGASIPSVVIKRIVAAGEDAQAQAAAGISYAVGQIADLSRNGVDGIHVYTMNHVEVGRAAYETLRETGYRA